MTGHVLEIQEVGIQLQPVPRTVTSIHPHTVSENWPHQIHEVLHVTSAKTGKAWYIDISGPQYGIDRPLWPSMEYTRAYIEDIVHVRPEGANKGNLLETTQ